MIREIIIAPDPRLKQFCAPVSSDVRRLIEDMFETMYAAPGRGLAAPQIGVLERLFVMDAGWKDGQMRPIAMINPVIDWRSEQMVTHEEACLSIPDKAIKVSRPDAVRIQWTDLAGTSQVARFTGIDAICAQHEMDHLDGRLITDHADA